MRFPFKWVVLAIILMFCAVIGMGIFTHTLTMTLCIIGAVMLIAAGWVMMIHNVQKPPKTTLGFTAVTSGGKTVFLNEMFDSYDNLIIDGDKVNISTMHPARLSPDLDIHPDMHLDSDKVYYYRKSGGIIKDRPVFSYIRENNGEQHLACAWSFINLDPNDRTKSFRDFMDTVEKELMGGLRDKLELRTGNLDDMGNRKRFKRMLYDEFGRLWNLRKPLNRIMLVSGITRGSFSRFRLFNVDDLEEWSQFYYYRSLSDAEKKRFTGTEGVKTGKLD